MGGDLNVTSDIGSGSDFCFDPVLKAADPEAELAGLLPLIAPGQRVVVVDAPQSNGLVQACERFGLGVTRVSTAEEVPAGDLHDCGIISSTEQAHALRGSRFLPLVLRAPQIPELNMRQALDFSLASVIETNRNDAELCSAIMRALAKSMRRIEHQRGQADWKILIAEECVPSSVPTGVTLTMSRSPDSNKVNQIVAKRILTRHGITDVTIVENGAQAVEAAKATAFTAILSDVSMPVLGAFIRLARLFWKRGLTKDMTAAQMVERRLGRSAHGRTASTLPPSRSSA